MSSDAHSANKDREQFGSSFTSFIINLFMTFLLWLFGLAIFVPMSSLVSGPNLAPFVGFIFFIAIVYFVAKALHEGKRAVDSYVRLASPRSRKLKAKTRLTFVKNEGYMALTLLAGVATIPFVWSINPVLGGIVLVAVVVISMFFALPLLQRTVEKLASVGR